MRPRPEQPTVTLILRDLDDGPATVVDLEAAIGINRRNLRPYITLLKGEGLIRITGWEQRTGPPLPIYDKGEGKDARRPKLKTPRRKKKIHIDVIAN
jgi:hypothetical protein